MSSLTIFIYHSKPFLAPHSHARSLAKEHKNAPSAFRSPNLNTVGGTLEYGLPSELLAWGSKVQKGDFDSH